MMERHSNGRYGQYAQAAEGAFIFGQLQRKRREKEQRKQRRREKVRRLMWWRK